MHSFYKVLQIHIISFITFVIHLIDEGDEPLGTAAGIRNIVSDLKDECFIVINSDVWTDYPLDQLKVLDLNDDLAHIVLVETPDYLAGDFDINGEAITTGKKYVFSGIGKYHTELFKKYNDKDLGDILRAEEKISFSIYDGQWMDIGTPERLKQIKELI